MDFATVQITATWGDCVIGVFRVEARDGFCVGSGSDVDFSAPIDRIEVLPAAETHRGGARVHAGDFAFDIEGVAPPWARVRVKPNLRTAIAVVATVATHASFAFFAARAAPPNEDAEAAERMHVMAMYLMKSDEAEMEADECNNPDKEAECSERYSDAHSRKHWHWVDYDDGPLPDGRDGCSAFGPFWMIALPCAAHDPPDSWGPVLSGRMVTDSFHAHERGLGAPSIRIEHLQAEGPVPRTVIARALEARRRYVEPCYETALRIDPDLAGQITLIMTSRKGGAGIGVPQPMAPGLRDLGDCAVRALHPMPHFSEEEAETTATFALAFTPY